jgi:hypothetical protein
MILEVDWKISKIEDLGESKEYSIEYFAKDQNLKDIATNYAVINGNDSNILTKILDGCERASGELASAINVYLNVDTYTGGPATDDRRSFEKFLKRSSVKDKIMSEMATENITRVYSGEWAETDLISLSSDTALNEILANISALAYEIAYYKVSQINNPLITTEIKNGWMAKLASHFYN